MKITIDTEQKTLTVENGCNANDLYDLMYKLDKLETYTLHGTPETVKPIKEDYSVKLNPDDFNKLA